MLYLIAGLLSAFLISIFSIPSIIGVAKIKNLYDESNERKSHKGKVPTLGGVAIFAGLMISISLYSNSNYFSDFQFIIAALLIIFFIGIKDDILMIAPIKKMLGQFLAASIVVVFGGIKITSFYGVFGLNSISSGVQIPLTIFTIIVINNAINLIDGVNGLCAGIGVTVFTTLGIWFYNIELQNWALMSFSLVGALLGFLKYNITPAKIFLGDTGSLTIGFLSAILIIIFIESSNTVTESGLSVNPVMAIGILMIPLFDTLRVFSIRILRKQSPFTADKNHLHHKLIGLGLSHEVSSLILTLVNLIFIVVSFMFHGLNPNLLLVVFVILAGVFILILDLISRKYESNK